MAGQAFTRAFELEAIRPLDPGRQPAAAVACELGIMREKDPDALLDRPRRPEADGSAEAKRLNRERERVTEKRDIQAAPIDLFSRKVVAWADGRVPDAGALCLASLRMAIEQRKPRPGPIDRTDRGSIHASRLNLKVLDQRGQHARMNRKGNPC